jgi:hypothetical protein
MADLEKLLQDLIARIDQKLNHESPKPQKDSNPIEDLGSKCNI